MYHTKRGDFESLQIMRAAYLDADDREKYWLDPFPHIEESWDPEVLHASEIGGCPRATAYRLLGTPEKPRSASSRANRRIMFNAGYRFHYLTYSAMKWAGILVDFELPVELPPGWTGRADAVICPDFEGQGAVGYDMKTVLPNALKYRYDMPKLKDCLQLTAYSSLGFTEGIIEYADRAGSNTPEESPVEVARWTKLVDERMRALEAVRDALPILPPVLGRVYVPHYSKQGQVNVLKEITDEQPWSCGYCDYHLVREEQRKNPNTGRLKKHAYTCAESVCKPLNDPPYKVSEWEGGRLVKTKDEHYEALSAWIDAQLVSYPVYEEDE